MFTRDRTDLKVKDIKGQIDTDVAETIQARGDDVEFHLNTDTDRSIKFRTHNTDGDGLIEVPVTQEGLKQVAGWLDVPYKFFERVDRDLQQHLATELVKKQADPMAITLLKDNGGIQSIHSPEQTRLAPVRFVDIAERVISPDAEVIDFRCDADTFHLDVTVPDNFDRGLIGDPKIDDLSKAGLRIGQNRKRNLAPSVQPYFFRLWCTNGCSSRHDGLRLDARGKTEQELMHSMEEIATRAFAMVEDEIEAFYNMRSEAVADASQAVLRLGRERGLPDRMVMGLVEQVPQIESTGPNESISMFDVVNLVTNAANDPSLNDRLDTRLRLEDAAGAEITEHAARCRTCASKLN